MNLFAFYIALSIFALYSCLNSPVTINDVSKEQKFQCFLGKNTMKWGLRIEKNTLNDTARIGIKNIWPGRTGLVFRSDRPLEDTIDISYYPYKATSGELILKCLCD